MKVHTKKNDEFLEPLWDGDRAAHEILEKIENEIIKEMGYEKYFPEKV